MFWLLYLLLEVFVWNFQVREFLCGELPVVQMAASALCDLFWLPLAIALPIYIMQLIAKSVQRFIVRDILIGLFGAIVLIAAVQLRLLFRVQFLLIAIFAVLWLYHIFQSRTISVRLICFSLALAPMILFYRTQLLPTITPVGAEKRLIVMSFNFNTAAAMDDARAVAFIRAAIPEVIFLQEFGNAEMRRLVAATKDLYPYTQTPKAGGGDRDVMILSRLPILSGKDFQLEMTYKTEKQFANHAVIAWNGQKIHLVNCHLNHSVRPLTAVLKTPDQAGKLSERLRRTYADHREEALFLANYVKKLPGPVILAGDFNDTPNSYVYNQFSHDLQNTFAAAGWGLGATFGEWTLQQQLPRWLPGIAFDYLRIDHIFCSRHFKVMRAQVSALAAFDHRPQVAVLTLAK